MTMKDINAIATLRKRAGLTQLELADQLGVSENTIANWEKGSASKWIRQLYKLCSLLHCSLDDLLLDEETETQQHYLLTPKILETVRKRCHALLQKNQKAAAKIASYATFHDPDLRYWIEQADSIARHLSDQKTSHSSAQMDCEAVTNTLMLQNLLNQLSCVPPDDITFQGFQNFIEPVHLTSAFIERSAVFDDECYQRRHILQTHPLSVYVIGWKPGQMAGMHHHGNALDAIQVIKGEMAYWTLTPEESEKRKIPFEGGVIAAQDKSEPQTILKAGDRVFVDRCYAHQIANLSNEDLITIHFRVGMPPLDNNWSLSKNNEQHSFRWKQVDECILTLA